VLTGVLNQLPQVPDRKTLTVAKEVLVMDTIKGSNLISLNFSIKPLVGNRSRRQVASLITSGCVYHKDQSDRSVSTKSPTGQFSSQQPTAWHLGRAG
jgi:hypothetical protein